MGKITFRPSFLRELKNLPLINYGSRSYTKTVRMIMSGMTTISINSSLSGIHTGRDWEFFSSLPRPE